jgi:hypothetical protein
MGLGETRHVASLRNVGGAALVMLEGGMLTANTVVVIVSFAYDRR